MNRILNYTISDADAGMIVLDFLRKQGFSRHILTAMKADKEALSVNDQKVGGRTILCAGDHFRVRLLETVSPDGIIPASMDIPVLYEDEDILVVNKPADMPVHPSIGNYTNTLANGIAGSQRRNLSIPLYQSSRPGHLRGIDSCKKRAQRRCPFRPDAKQADSPHLSRRCSGNHS